MTFRTLVAVGVLCTTAFAPLPSNAAPATPAAASGTIAVPRALEAPSAVRSLRLQAIDRGVMLRWKKPADVGSRRLTGFVIQRRRIDGSWETITTVAASIRSFKVGSLPNGTPQRFRVAAVSAAGRGAWSPERVIAVPSVLDVAASGYNASGDQRGHGCAVTPARTVVCWGSNSSQQLGVGTGNGVTGSPLPVAVKGLTAVKEVDTGAGHSCALRINGTVWCWGDDGHGQVGEDAAGGPAEPQAVPVAGLSGVVDIDAGGLHTCAVLADGSGRCWGNDDWGQLGNGAAGGTGSPSPVDTIAPLAEISAGMFHTCARTRAGAALCWGQDILGQVGAGVTAPGDIFRSPTAVDDLSSGIVDIAAGTDTSCAVKSDGSAACWGRGDSGELGNGTATAPFADTRTPVPVVDAGDMRSVSVGFGFACGVYADGTGRCWGSDFVGTLGDGDSMSTRARPDDPVAIALRIRSITAGYNSVCALLRNGTPRCWGSNQHGRLGDGSITNRPVPVRIVGY